MSRILVTGATGFVGRRLVPALINLGHQVRVAVTKRQDNFQAEQVIISPIEEHQDWTEALSGIEVVIHLAARVHIMNDKAQNPLDEYIKVNSHSTKHIAEQAVKHQVKRFIYISSIKVNGELTQPDSPFTEDCKEAPLDAYGHSKLIAENYLLAMSRQGLLEVVILRPPLVYGPEVKANFLNMMKLVSKKWPLPFRAIQNKRSFVYIDNLVSAIATVVDHPYAANQTYLVADNEALSIGQLLQVVGEGMGVKVHLFPITKRWLEFVFKSVGLSSLNTRLLESLEVDTHKIKSQLNWNPPVTTRDGLIKTARWYKNANSH
jgi:nucleoside-diphosphate-sugar epimerase